MSEMITSALSTATLLELHHQRLDDMLDDIELAADAENWSEARRRFDAFREEMDEHIRLEEEMMFPAFEAASMGEGPTTVMRGEHVTIRALLMEVDDALAQKRPISRTTAALEAQLGVHNFKEERVLYPAFERRVPSGVRAALAAEVETLLRERG